MALYPSHLARLRELADRRRVTIRPIREDDGAAESEFFGALAPESRRMRFMNHLEVPDEELIRYYTHIDYDRHMAFVCEAEIDGRARIIGEARYIGNPGERCCELGIVVADTWRHSGVAQLLMDALIRAAQARGFETMAGLVLGENRDMLDFVQSLGFEIVPMPEQSAMVRVVRKL
jgi:acetyltransferase